MNMAKEELQVHPARVFYPSNRFVEKSWKERIVDERRKEKAEVFLGGSLSTNNNNIINKKPVSEEGI
jgi:hypothetical protein